VNARRSLLTGGLLVVADAWLLPLQAPQAAQPVTTAGTPRAATGRPANAVPALAMDIRLDPATRLLQGEGTWTVPPGVALELALDRRFRLESITADGRAQPLPPDGTGRLRVAIAASPSRSQSWQFRWRGELAALDGGIDHRGGNAVFHAPERIHVLDLADDGRHAAFRHPSQSNQRRPADALRDVVANPCRQCWHDHEWTYWSGSEGIITTITIGLIEG
jgi:hypothetical protein